MTNYLEKIQEKIQELSFRNGIMKLRNELVKEVLTGKKIGFKEIQRIADELLEKKF